MPVHRHLSDVCKCHFSCSFKELRVGVSVPLGSGRSWTSKGRKSNGEGGGAKLTCTLQKIEI